MKGKPALSDTDSIREIAERLSTLEHGAAVGLALSAVEGAAALLERYFAGLPNNAVTYVDSIVGLEHTLDAGLGSRALTWVQHAVATGVFASSPEISKAYGEPLSALQDDDLDLPDPIEQAFYAIYNLYRAATDRGPRTSERLSRAIHQALAARPSGEDVQLATWWSAALERVGG